MKQWLLKAFVVVGLLAQAGASPAGFVVRVEGPRIVINRGAMDQVRIGDRFVIVRQGRNIAEVVVHDVYRQESKAVVAQLFSPESVLAGDAISQSGDLSTPAVALNPPQPRSLTPTGLTVEQARQDYEELLGPRTQSQKFSQKWSGKNDSYSDLNDLNLSTTLDSLGYSIWTGGWWGTTDLLVRSANQALMAQHLRDHMMKDYVARMELEIVQWDQALLEAFCKLQAAQQGLQSQEELAALRSQMTRERALDRNDVFQVRLKNIGELPIELAPFHWHIFLNGPDDKRVIATRYDKVLDRKLSPNQEVVGFVTFPKVPQRQDLRLILEDIYGDQGEFTFSQ